MRILGKVSRRRFDLTTSQGTLQSCDISLGGLQAGPLARVWLTRAAQFLRADLADSRIQLGR